MAINKVVYGDQTLIDLTGDTVEASNLLEGETAHTRSGSSVTGTAKQGHIVKDADGTAMTQRPAIKFADADVSDDSTNQQTVVEVMHDPMTLANFLDAQNLDDGIYPVTEDDNTVLSSDMISHGNGTVEQAIDGKVSKSGDTISGPLNIDEQNGSVGIEAFSTIALGNDKAYTQDKNSTGNIRLYSSTGNSCTIFPDAVTDNRSVWLPNASGTLALKSDTNIYTSTPLTVAPSEDKMVSLPQGYVIIWSVAKDTGYDLDYDIAQMIKEGVQVLYYPTYVRVINGASREYSFTFYYFQR